MTRKIVNRKWKIGVVMMALMFLLPATTFAAAEVELNTETAASAEVVGEDGYSHCFKHNLNYSLNTRCGEGSSSKQLAQSSEYGPFLCGVCQKCMDSGDCSLTDIMIVTGNTGNFLLGIVGSIALLIFVIGGVITLTSQGEKQKVAKGQQFMIAAAVGIAITLGAVLILRTTISTLTSGSPGSGSAGYAVCDDTNDGATCGEASECSDGICTGRCEITATETGVAYSCVDPTTVGDNNCIPNRCPGGNDNVCCDTTVDFDYDG